jgi:hypothetical protein
MERDIRSWTDDTSTNLVLMDGLGTLHEQDPDITSRISSLFQDTHRYVNNSQYLYSTLTQAAGHQVRIQYFWIQEDQTTT